MFLYIGYWKGNKLSDAYQPEVSPFPSLQKSPLPVDLRRSKTSLLKLPDGIMW